MLSPQERQQRLQRYWTSHAASAPSQTPAARVLGDAIRRAEELQAEHFLHLAKVLRMRQFAPGLPAPAPPFHTVVLKPVGNQCNLRCRYCFNPIGAVPGTQTDPSLAQVPVMAESVLKNTIASALAAGPDTVHFIWHGGEPMTAGLAFFESAVKLQQELNTQGKTIKNSMQTNGTLLNEQWIAFFQRHGFGIGISLDGPETSHDRYRRDAAGAGTFHRVMDAIRQLRACGIECGVSAVVTPHMEVTPKDFFSAMVNLGIKRFAVNPCSWPDELALSQAEYAQFLSQLFDVWLDAGITDVHIRPLEDIIAGLLGHPLQLCWMAGTCTQFVGLEPNGDVWPCCDRTLPDISYRWGNVLETELADIVRNPVAQAFTTAANEPQSPCTKCQWWHYLCGGGCVHHRITHGDAPDARDPLCPGYKRLFSHVVGRIDDMLLET